MAEESTDPLYKLITEDFRLSNIFAIYRTDFTGQILVIKKQFLLQKSYRSLFYSL